MTKEEKAILILAQVIDISNQGKESPNGLPYTGNALVTKVAQVLGKFNCGVGWHDTSEESITCGHHQS